MKRLWIPLDNLEVYDEMHVLQPDGSFQIDEAKDGQNTQQHIEGIKYIKGVLESGQKIRPILALDNEDGTFTRLDGFKRCMANVELHKAFIEAFVCDQEEYRQRAVIPYHEGEMWCGKGGQEKEQYGLFEGGEKESFDYGAIDFLYKAPNADELRIEACECIHVHFGPSGKWRLDLGRRDFEALAEAISSI